MATAAIARHANKLALDGDATMINSDVEDTPNGAELPKSEGQNLQSLFAEGIACIATQKCDLRATCALSNDIPCKTYARRVYAWSRWMERELCRQRYGASMHPSQSVAPRNDNLFQDLETRTLTSQEQDIINQRVCDHGDEDSWFLVHALTELYRLHRSHDPKLLPLVSSAPSQVALQRRLFEEYERRELTRKVQELREVCPQLSKAAAARALELCNGRYGPSVPSMLPAFCLHYCEWCAS